MTPDQTDGNPRLDPKLDPEMINMTQNVARGLAEARAAGPSEFAAYLDRLSGKLSFAITGVVFVPRLTKAFGDWVFAASSLGTSYEIEREEFVDTNFDHSPSVYRGHEAYRSGHASVDKQGRVVLLATQEFEDGQTRILYPERLDRFELVEVSATDPSIKAEREHDRRMFGEKSTDLF